MTVSQVLYSIALTEIKQGDLHTGEDTLHQALYDTELGQRRLIQEALNNIQVILNLEGGPHGRVVMVANL